MEMFKIIIFEYLLGHVLQSFIIVLGIYTFNRQKIIVKDYLLISILITILSYLVRLLPITVGVHTIVNILLTYLICVILLKMPAYATIRSTSICVVLILLCEMFVTSIVLMNVGNEQYEKLTSITIQRAYIGVLANIIFTLVVTISYFILQKTGDKHRNISS